MSAPTSPGPWEVHENCVRTVAPGRCVCRADWDIRDEVDDANLSLMAAAPDLLGALRWLRAFWKPGSNHDTDEVKVALATADAALAKASPAEFGNIGADGVQS